MRGDEGFLFLKKDLLATPAMTSHGQSAGAVLESRPPSALLSMERDFGKIKQISGIYIYFGNYQRRS